MKYTTAFSRFDVISPDKTKEWIYKNADTKTDELIYTPSYYYIGHFSKFIKSNAKRISTTTSRSTIESTSFINKNGEIVTVVLNKTDNDVKYKLIVDENQVSLKIRAHAIQTITY